MPVNVNYAWRAVQDSAFLGSDDRELGEFAMSIYPAPSSSPRP